MKFRMYLDTCKDGCTILTMLNMDEGLKWVTTECVSIGKGAYESIFGSDDLGHYNYTLKHALKCHRSLVRMHGGKEV